MINDLGGDQWLEQGLCTSFKNGIPDTPEDMKTRDYAF
jgi:magnesium-transporting ATPase (P-type)